MNNIEISSDERLLFYKKEYTPDFVASLISEKRIRGLRIFALLKEDRLENINFLSRYIFLEHLSITSMSDFDFSVLKELRQLKTLSINTQGTSKIDLSEQKELQSLDINWRKNIVGLNRSLPITKLLLTEYDEKDLN